MAFEGLSKLGGTITGILSGNELGPNYTEIKKIAGKIIPGIVKEFYYRGPNIVNFENGVIAISSQTPDKSHENQDGFISMEIPGLGIINGSFDGASTFRGDKSTSEQLVARYTEFLKIQLEDPNSDFLRYLKNGANIITTDFNEGMVKLSTALGVLQDGFIDWCDNLGELERFNAMEKWGAMGYIGFSIVTINDRTLPPTYNLITLEAGTTEGDKLNPQTEQIEHTMGDSGDIIVMDKGKKILLSSLYKNSKITAAGAEKEIDAKAEVAGSTETVDVKTGFYGLDPAASYLNDDHAVKLKTISSLRISLVKGLSEEAVVLMSTDGALLEKDKLKQKDDSTVIVIKVKK